VQLSSLGSALPSCSCFSTILSCQPDKAQWFSGSFALGLACLRTYSCIALPLVAASRSNDLSSSEVTHRGQPFAKGVLIDGDIDAEREDIVAELMPALSQLKAWSLNAGCLAMSLSRSCHCA